MGEIYNRFKELKTLSSKNRFMDKIGLVKFDHPFHCLLSEEKNRPGFTALM